MKRDMNNMENVRENSYSVSLKTETGRHLIKLPGI